MKFFQSNKIKRNDHEEDLFVVVLAVIAVG